MIRLICFNQGKQDFQAVSFFGTWFGVKNTLDFLVCTGQSLE